MTAEIRAIWSAVKTEKYGVSSFVGLLCPTSVQYDAWECMLEAGQSTEVRDDIAARPATVRSRVTNGKMIAGVDGRSAEARRYRDLAMAFADDCGGAAGLTEAQRTLVRQAATLTVQSEKLQGAMLRGEEMSDEQMTRVANSLSRTLSRLGIRKRADRKLSVPEYLALRDARRASG
jgi:hypothetical protein